MTTPHERGPLTRGELLALPAAVDLETAARAFDIGRSTAYALAKAGDFPCKVVRAGRTYRVLTTDLLRVLSVSPGDNEGGAGPVKSDAA